jgi:hypothetical protein
MAYEIPQKLQYEEKILFGLTFKQLVYALILILPALVIFLKTKWDLYVKLAIDIFLISLAVMFMFCNFQNYLKNIFSWLKFREVFYVDKKMKDFIGIDKIEENIIYVNRK